MTFRHLVLVRPVVRFPFRPSMCGPSAGGAQAFDERLEGGRMWQHVAALFNFITKASMLAEFFFALAIGSGMSCVP